MRPRHAFGAFVATTALVTGLCSVASAADAPAPSPTTDAVAQQRGTVVSATRLARLDRRATDQLLRRNHYPAAEPDHGVTTYRVVYRTVTRDRASTLASGLVVLPRSSERTLQPVLYEHGTLVDRRDAPSAGGDDIRAGAVLFGADGFAAVVPDYLGLGRGPGHHPFLDARTEASASVDLLRAARTVAARRGRTVLPDVRVTGFSQGGQAATAAGRVLDRRAPGFSLAALAPVSGPYALRRAQLPAILHRQWLDPLHATYYLGYWVTSAQRRLPLYDHARQAFRRPYAAGISDVYDGGHSQLEVLGFIPGTPEELFTPAFMRRLDHPHGALLRATRQSDGTCAGWTPSAPVRLYASRADRDVAYRNAELCRRQLAAADASVRLVGMGDIGHFDTQWQGLPRVLRWFSALR